MSLTAATVHFDANVSGTGWHDLIDSPDPGTSILVYKAYLMNGCWVNNWVNLRLSNPLTGQTFFLFLNTAWSALTSTQVPVRYKDGPIVFESGWKLEVYSSALSSGGLTVDINYGIDIGYESQPSDYHAAFLQLDPGSGTTVLPLVAAAPVDKVRHVKSVLIANQDTIMHPCWSRMRDDGGSNPAFLWNIGNVASISCAHFPYIGEGITLDENIELAIHKGTVDVTTPSLAYASYLEAGGYPDIGPNDTGPWTDSQQIIQRRSIALDGQLDRLMTYPTAAAFIGLENHWTILMWSRPLAFQANREWLFMLGGLSNHGAIHLSRNTDPAVGSYGPYEIEVHEDAVTKKLYRWGGTIGLGYWECVAVTFDGDAADGIGTEKVQVWKNGTKYPWFDVTKITDDAIGVLTDENRYIGLGGVPTGTGTDNDGFHGEIWNAMAWSRVLSDEELTYLSNPYNSHYDLRASHGPYVAGVDLEHYYRPGLMYSPNLGKDYGLGGDTTDLTYEEDIDDTDLVDNYPGKGLF